MTCNTRVDEWPREFDQNVAANNLPTVYGLDKTGLVERPPGPVCQRLLRLAVARRLRRNTARAISAATSTAPAISA
jgi:hypothetical protein